MGVRFHLTSDAEPDREEVRKRGEQFSQLARQMILEGCDHQSEHEHSQHQFALTISAMATTMIIVFEQMGFACGAPMSELDEQRFTKDLNAFLSKENKLMAGRISGENN